MTYKTGSITSATPAKALFDLIDPDLVAVGYTRVETGLASGGVTWAVYKSPAASNFFGADWYFALGYDTSAQTTLYSCVMEDWDATNDLAIRFAPSTTGLVPGTGYITPQSPAALPAGFTLSHLLPTTAFTYAYSALIDRLALAAWTGTTTSRFGWYVGLYDSFYSTADDPFPLVIVNISLVSAASAGRTDLGSSTREPMTTVGNTNNFFVSQGSYCVWNLNASNLVLPGPWNAPAVNSYTADRPWVSRVFFTGRGGASASVYYANWPRGLLRDLFTDRAGLNNGDRVTWTANGTSYAGVCYGARNSSANAFTVQNIYIPEY